MRRFFYLLVLFFLFIGILYAIKTSRQKKTVKTQEFEQSPFIKSKKSELYVDGRLFRSVGVNRYNLLSYDSEEHCANSFSEEDIDRMFSELHDLSITSVRFWLFQSFTKSGEDLERFDYVIEKAKLYKIRLIPVFENHWADCTEGGVKENWWYESGYLKPYGEYDLSLKDYIEKIVSQYKNDPTILAWQIMNEAESPDNESLYNFAKDMSQHIRSLDKNHLISFGTTGTKQSGELYRKIHALPTVDILEYHDYDDLYNEIPEYLSHRIADAKALNKPLMVGEAGLNKEVSDHPDLLKAKMKAFFKKGGDLYLLWSYGDSTVTDDGHNFDASDPFGDIIKSITKNLNN